MKSLIILTLTLLITSSLSAQPWRGPLKICRSTDGITFTSVQTFQDSSGVPCIIKLNDGRLICAFQWGRQPVGSLTWDRVAVKFSNDSGATWTDPVPVVVNNLPSNYQRPFDPTLVITDDGRIRMFFSSGQSTMIDSSINTYSATSDDGINYTLDPGVRFSMPEGPVIDPAVIRFRNLWHLENPAGAPAEGAYHNISGDGLNYSRVSNINSDASHNWTGNYVVNDTNELRFYGTGASGTTIWYSSSPNGGEWSSYVHTNIHGGDPGVVKVSDNNYIMIYTGPLYVVSVNENNFSTHGFSLNQNYPNPFNPATVISFNLPSAKQTTLRIFDINGKDIALLLDEVMEPGSHSISFNGEGLPSGIYFYELKAGEFRKRMKMVLLK